MSKTREEMLGLKTYQSRVLDATAAALGSGSDVLVEAPTGAGKTAMEAVMAAEFVEKNPGKKALVLTHRRVIFRQMVGGPSDEGEVSRWGGINPGTISPAAMGGDNLSPNIIVGMVQTVGPRLSENPDFLRDVGLLIVDEAHHASADGSERENTADYSKIIDKVLSSGGRVAGFTATSYRADGDGLHPAFEKGHREIVGYHEAMAAGRIVPVRTIEGKAPLDAARGRDIAGSSALAGSSAVDVWDDMTAGVEKMTADRRLARENSVSASIRRRRGDAFWDGVVSEHERLLSGKKTIVFVDSVSEIEDMQKRLDAAMGHGISRGVHAGRTSVENRQAIEAYGKDHADGGADILVACKMIDEGFNVPRTDAVVLASVSLSKAQMNQYAGRAVRAAPGKTEAILLDFGVSTHRHGKIEHQHAVQSMEASIVSRDDLSRERSFQQMAPSVQKDGSLRVMLGERVTLAMVETIPGRFDVFSIDHDSTVGKSEKKSRTAPVVRPVSVGKDISRKDAMALVFERSRDEAAWFSRHGGFSSDYAQKCADKASAVFSQIQPWIEKRPTEKDGSLGGLGRRDSARGSDKMTNPTESFSWSAVMRNDPYAVRWRSSVITSLGKVPEGGEKKSSLAATAKIAASVLSGFSKEGSGDDISRRRAALSSKKILSMIRENPANISVFDYAAKSLGQTAIAANGAESRFLHDASSFLDDRYTLARDSIRARKQAQASAHESGTRESRGSL